MKLKMNNQSVYYLMLSVIALLIIASLAGANEIVVLLNKQATSLVSLKAQSQALTTEQTNLIIAKKDLLKYSPLEKITNTIVPQNKDQAQAVREIANLAQQNGITLNSITFPSSTLGSGAQPNNSKISLSQLTPVKGVSGVYTLPIQVQVSQTADAVSYSSFYNFLTSLEQNRLTSQVTSLSIQPLTQKPNLINFSLTINEYIKPL
jgi:hypothetical protein